MDYKLLLKELDSLISDCAPVSALSNASSLIYHELPDVSWAGFYILRGKDLILGPFQGKTACIVIPSGRGVCGECVRTSSTVLVPDVELFPGHIACDAGSRSEIVVPIFADGVMTSVLDIDSYTPGRFTEDDRDGLEQAARIIGERTGKTVLSLV